jgi:ribose transport system substrate-binding protein
MARYGRFRRIGVLASLAVAGPMLASCTSSTSTADVNRSAPASSSCVYSGNLTGLPSSYAKPTPKKLKIGWLNPIGANEAANAGQAAAKRETERLGGTFIPFDSKGQPNVQLNGFQQLLNQGVDAIAVYPLDPKGLAPVLAQAAAAHVPVISIDAYPDPANPVGGFTSNLLIGRDLYAFEQAKYLASAHPGGEAAIVKFGFPNPSIEYFAERARFWATKCGLTVDATVANQTDDPAGAEQVLTPLLQRRPKIDGVLAYNDSSAVGAVTAARGLSRSITALGVNGDSIGISAVKSGQIPLTLQLPEVQYGIQMVDAAYNAAAGVALPKEVLLSPPYLMVTKDTVANGQAKTYQDQLTAAFNGGG